MNEQLPGMLVYVYGVSILDAALLSWLALLWYRRCDPVLMDVRSFSTHSTGSIFELGQLVRRLSSDDIVLVCDNSTDLPLLQRTLGDAWAVARQEGRARGSGRISVVRVERQSRADFAFVMQRLLAKPHAAGVPL